MSFAAFMGGGDKEGSKGFMGRAVQINDENRVIDKQKDVLEHEYELKTRLAIAQQAADSPPFTIKYTLNGKQKKFTFNRDPSYLENHRKLDAATQLMSQFSVLPVEDKEAIKNDIDAWNKLQGPIGVIANNGYELKISQFDGSKSYTLPTHLPTYKNEWDYTNIWKDKDKEIAGRDTPVTTGKGFRKALGIVVGKDVSVTNQKEDVPVPVPEDIKAVEPISPEAPNLKPKTIFADTGRWEDHEAEMILSLEKPLLNMQTSAGIFRPVNTQLDSFAEEFLTDEILNNPSVLIEAVSTAAMNKDSSLTGNNFQVRTNIAQEEKMEIGIRENTTAVMLGIDSAYELIKLTAGYWTTEDGKEVYHAPVPLVAGAADLAINVKALVTSVEDLVSYAKGTLTIDSMYTGDTRWYEKDERGNTITHDDNASLRKDKFLDTDYGGMTPREFREYQDNPEKFMKEKGMDQMYRVKALQIHLAFQLAIAMQGYQGGKAVSDADFDRAWELISGNKNRGGFLRFSTREAATTSLKLVMEQFAAQGLKNKAWLEARPGTRNQTSDFVYEVARRKSQKEGSSLGFMALEAWFIPTGNKGTRIDWQGFEEGKLEGDDTWGWGEDKSGYSIGAFGKKQLIIKGDKSEGPWYNKKDNSGGNNVNTKKKITKDIDYKFVPIGRGENVQT